MTQFLTCQMKLKLTRIKALKYAHLQSELYSKRNNMLFNIPQQNGENTDDTLIDHLQTVGIPILDEYNMFATVQTSSKTS